MPEVYHALGLNLHQPLGNGAEIRQLITTAYDRILTAETSCNFYWGSRWVCRSFDELEQAYHLLDTAMGKLK
jgi:4-alpha-glucanotransferase